MSNYAIKAGLKNATGAGTTKFAEKVDLASLKSEVDKLDIGKLEKVPTGLNSLKGEVDKLDVDILVPAPADFSKLSDAVKYVVKETEYNDLFKKINAIKTTDTSNLVKKNKKKLTMTQELMKLKNNYCSRS